MNDAEIKARMLSLEGIEQLNDMQEAALTARGHSLMIIAPTGSGKTLAFGARLLKSLGAPAQAVQALVIAPSRELVMQIASVMRQLARGYKTVALYGGHSVADEVSSFSPVPDIVVATPGRLLDHLQRGHLAVGGGSLRCLVLDEYDKSLQLGFEGEMKRIMHRVGRPKERVLISATMLDPVPDYVGMTAPEVIDDRSVETVAGHFDIIEVKSYTRDKLDTLVALLRTLPVDEKVMVFVNHRESAERIYRRLLADGVPGGLYHGGLDQQQRTVAVDLFANGTTPVLVATDLAARGLDVDNVGAIVHYHLPVDEAAWTHRNGRSARQGGAGDVFVITSEADSTAPYIVIDRRFQPSPESDEPRRSKLATLYFTAGKKEKISRGDVLGFILANSSLEARQIGRINVHDHFALAAVPCASAAELAKSLSAAKLKGKRVRVSLMKN